MKPAFAGGIRVNRAANPGLRRGRLHPGYIAYGLGYRPTRFLIVPTLCVTAIKLSRHSGMDRRNPDCRDTNNLCHPWSLGSGDPCRNDEFFLNLMAVTLCVGMPPASESDRRSGKGCIPTQERGNDKRAENRKKQSEISRQNSAITRENPTPTESRN